MHGMSTSVSAPAVRRWRRWHSVLLALVCTGAAAAGWGLWRTARVQRLVAEIEQAGGKVELGSTTWTLFWDRVNGWGGKNPTRVRLARGTTQEWLTSWDDLSDLSIEMLKIDEPAKLGPELARLVGRHPLETLYAPGVKGADEIAAVLSVSRSLTELNLRDSDLTDEGLRRLPLEQLRMLNIAGTRVTLDGLRELRQLPAVVQIVLDGRQVNAETVALLEQNPNSYRLWLYGPDVNDETLQMLKTALGATGPHKMTALCVGQRQVSEVSESAMLAWQRDVPSVQIMHARDAEPAPSLRGRGFTPRFWTRWFGR